MSTEILQLARQYSGSTGCITFIFGIIGNTLNILVLTQLKLFRHNRCSFYIIVESISSFGFQLISITITCLIMIYGDDRTASSELWCKFQPIITQPLVLTTFSMICFSAIDQFFSTNYWLYRRQICTMKLAQCMTAGFICLWIVHSIAFGLHSHALPQVGCVIPNFYWLQYSSYVFYPLLVGLLPLVIASFFSGMAFRNVHRLVRRQIPIARRRLDKQMTAMVLLRVIMFVCLLLPYVAYRIYIINFPVPRTKPLEFAIARLVQAICMSFVAFNYAV